MAQAAKTNIAVRFDTRDPMLGAFIEFARTAMPETTLSDAVREACAAYMGTDPMEAARQAARRAAFLLARREFCIAIAAILRSHVAGLQVNAARATDELAAILAAHPDALSESEKAKIPA